MSLVADWDVEPLEANRRPDLTDATDEKLLADVRQQDPDAFGELWLRHVTAVRSCARAIAPADAVDDIVSEASLACWEAILHGRGPRTDFRAYMLQAVRSRTANKLTRKNPEAPTDEATITELDTQTGHEEVGDDGEADKVAAAFYSLPPRYRRVLLLREVEGLPMAMVATDLGTTLNNAYQVVFRARNQLRERFLLQAGSTDTLGLPEQVTSLPAVVPVDELPAKVKPGRVGRAIISGVIGVGVGTFVSAGRAEAFGGIAQIAQPTGMPALVVPAAAATVMPWWLKLGAGASTGAVAVVAAAALLNPQGVVTADTNPIVSIPPVASSPTAAPPSVAQPTPTPTPTPEVTPTPTPTRTPTVQKSSSAVASTQPPPSTTSVPPPPPPPPVAPIAVGSVDVGPNNVCSPLLTGKAIPGSQLLITTWDGTILTSTTADAAGVWSSGRLAGVRAGETGIFVSDPTGSQPEASTTVTVRGVSGLGASHAPGGLSVWVQGGIAGVPLVVTFDGTSVGTINLDASGEAMVVFDVTADPGNHTVSVHYQAPSCQGPDLSVPVNW